MKHVAVGIIMKDGRVLACQRRRTARYPLKWEFPGGKIEPGESPAQALARELREELLIDATIGREFFQQQWTYPLSSSGDHEDGIFHVRYFLIESFTGEPVSCAFEQIEWVTPALLSSMDVLEGNKGAVEHLIGHVQKQQEA